MANGIPRRRGSLVGALLLIILGVLFLASNLLPEWDVWPFMSRFWPVILIIWGVGKLIDALRAPAAPGAPGASPSRGVGGGVIALILVFGFFALATTREHWRSRTIHETQFVDAQGAESVAVSIDMTAGQLNISGGSTKLLDADFDYNWSEGKPQISYNPSGKDGRLTITQDRSLRWQREHNTWNLRMNGDAVRDLHIDMGAGQSDLRLGGMNLNRVSVQMGAGECIADLTGDWKHDADVKIEGGAGSATVRLPKGVGVRAHASGALGSIDVRGLRRENGYYVNDAFGKSPVTINVDVEGAVGQIRLIGD